MRVVTVARKPCLSSSTTENVVGHQAGAINIDATRIDFRGEDGHQMGRWPANVFLQHHPGCKTTLGNPNECETACPVLALDQQSGVLTSGSGTVKRASASNRKGNTSAAYGAESRTEGSLEIWYGDSGGASRFFKTIR